LHIVQPLPLPLSKDVAVDLQWIGWAVSGPVARREPDKGVGTGIGFTLLPMWARAAV